METNFCKSDRWIIKDMYNNKYEIRLISNETVMYQTLTEEDLYIMKSFIDRRLKELEQRKES